MDCRLNVTFVKPDWVKEGDIRQSIGWDTFGLSLIIPEDQVKERLKILYALPSIDSVEVVLLKEDD